MNSRNHHIQRLTIDFTAPDFQTARENQVSLRQWAGSEALWLAAGQVLDAQDIPGQVIRIPRLELEISIASEKAFQESFMLALQKGLESALLKIKQNSIVENSRQVVQLSDKIQPLNENWFEAMLYFLKNGVLPWYFPAKQSLEFEAFFHDFIKNASVTQIRLLRSEAGDSPVIFKRFHAILGAAALHDFVLQYIVKEKPASDWFEKMWLEQAISSKDPNASFTFLQTTFLHFEKIKANRWEDFKSEMQKYQDLNVSKPGPEPALPETNKFILNAGIVLLAPYLEQLFSATGYIENRHFKNRTSQEKAILLLNYIANGDLTAWEFEFPVFKLLCGFPMEMPVNVSLQLTDAEKRISDELLKFAIAQWPVMRNASFEGIRSTFLRRPGKLWQKEDDTWCLVIEKKTEDILLERLPAGWSFSVLKLPWMPQMLYVEW